MTTIGATGGVFVFASDGRLRSVTKGASCNANSQREGANQSPVSAHWNCAPSSQSAEAAAPSAGDSQTADAQLTALEGANPPGRQQDQNHQLPVQDVGRHHVGCKAEAALRTAATSGPAPALPLSPSGQDAWGCHVPAGAAVGSQPEKSAGGGGAGAAAQGSGGRLLPASAATLSPCQVPPQPHAGLQQQRHSQSSSSSLEHRDHPWQQALPQQHGQLLPGQHQHQQGAMGALEPVGCSGMHWNGSGSGSAHVPDAGHFTAAGSPAPGQQLALAPGSEAAAGQGAAAAPGSAHPPYPFPHVPPPYPYGRGGPLWGPGGYPYPHHHGYMRGGVAAATAGRPFPAGHLSSPYHHLQGQHPHTRSAWHHHPYGHSVYGHPHARLMAHQYHHHHQHQQQPSPDAGRGPAEEQQSRGGNGSGGAGSLGGVGGASASGAAVSAGGGGRFTPAAGGTFRSWAAGQHPQHPQQQQAAWNAGSGAQPSLQERQGQGLGQAQESAAAGLPLHQQHPGLHGAQQQQEHLHQQSSQRQHLGCGGPLRTAGGFQPQRLSYPWPPPAAARPDMPRPYPAHLHQPQLASGDEGRGVSTSSWGIGSGGSGGEGGAAVAGPAGAAAALAMSSGARRGSGGGGGGVWDGGMAASASPASYASAPGVAAPSAAAPPQVPPGEGGGLGVGATAPVPLPQELCVNEVTWPACVSAAAAHAGAGIFRRHSSFGSLGPLPAAGASTSPPYSSAGGGAGGQYHQPPAQQQQHPAVTPPPRASGGGWDLSSLPPPQPSGETYSSSSHGSHMRAASWCGSPPPAVAATAGAGPHGPTQPQLGLQVQHSHQPLPSAFSSGSAAPASAGFTAGAGGNSHNSATMASQHGLPAGAPGCATGPLAMEIQGGGAGDAAGLSRRMSSYSGLHASPCFRSSASGTPSEPQAPGSAPQQSAGAAAAAVPQPGAGCGYAHVSGLPAPRSLNETYSAGASAATGTGYSDCAVPFRAYSSSGLNLHALPPLLQSAMPAATGMAITTAAPEEAASPFRFSNSPPQTFEDIKLRLAQQEAAAAAAASADPALPVPPFQLVTPSAAPQPNPELQPPPSKRLKGPSEQGAAAASARKAAKVKKQEEAGAADAAPQGQQPKDAAAGGATKGSAGRTASRGGGGGGCRASALPAPVLVRVTSKRRTRNNNKNKFASGGSDGSHQPAAPPPPRRRRSSSGLAAGEDGLVPYREVYGTFHPGPYLRNKECIEHDGRMITRGHFERLGGTATAKWHVSIKVMPQNLALGKWLASHGLPVLTGKPRKPRSNEVGDSGGSGQPRRRSGRGRSADRGGDSDSDLDSEVEEEMLEELEGADGEEQDVGSEEEDEGTEEREEEGDDELAEERWQRRRRVPIARQRSSYGGSQAEEAVGTGATESSCPHPREQGGGNRWAGLSLGLGSPGPVAPCSLQSPLQSLHAPAAEGALQPVAAPLPVGPPPLRIDGGGQGSGLRPVVTSPPPQQHGYPSGDSSGLHQRQHPACDFPGFTTSGPLQQQGGHGQYPFGQMADEDVYGRLYGEFRTTSLEESAVHLLLDGAGGVGMGGGGCGGGDDDSLLLLPLLGGAAGNDAAAARGGVAAAAAAADRASSTSPAPLQPCPSSKLNVPQHLPPLSCPTAAGSAPASSSSSGSSGLHIEMPATSAVANKAAATGAPPPPRQAQQPEQAQQQLSDALMNSFFPY